MGAFCVAMDIEDAYRRWIKRVVDAGFTQKAIADWMGVQESWLSKWLAGKKADPIDAAEMRRLEEHARKLEALFHESPLSQADPVKVKGARSA